MSAIADQVEHALGRRPSRVAPLSGGCIGDVTRAWIEDGTSVAVKSAGPRGTLDVEGWMLEYLREHSRLPVPAVLHASPSLLILEFLEGRSSFSATAEVHAAELLVDLHSITAPTYGLERDTLIGPLRQVNTPSASWIEFFRDRRLLHMAGVALESGGIDERLNDRIRQFAEALPRFVEEPDQPSLIHGDAWTTNILASSDRITGFLDPSIHYAHPEIELAFTTLFGTFGDAFFARYQQLRPIRPGFFEQRRDIYNLYPLLVHARLFGGGYGAQAASILRGLGF